MARKRGNNKKRNQPEPEGWPVFNDIPTGIITGRYKMTVYAVQFNRSSDPMLERLRTAATATAFDEDGNKLGKISPRVVFNITTDIMRNCATMTPVEFDDAIDAMALAAKAEGDPRNGSGAVEELMASRHLIDAVRDTLNTTIFKATKTQLDVGLPAQRAEFIAAILARYCAKCGNIKIAGLPCACPQKEPPT